MGFCTSQSNRKVSLNVRNLLVAVLMVQGMLGITQFLICRADTIAEYGLGFYVSITQFTIIVVALAMALNIGNIHALIEDAEAFIETGSCFGDGRFIRSGLAKINQK